MSASIYFHDLPVYRCSREKHSDELEKERQRIRSDIADHLPAEKVKAIGLQMADNLFDSNYWYPWKNNEIIGWVRLYALGSQIRGELWFIRAKRIRRDLNKKRLYYQGKAFELSFYPKDSPTKIIDAIKTELQRIKSNKPLKGRYLDTENFENVAKLIDWHRLLGFK